MIPDILIPLILTSLAELGDKTQVSILLLSSETKRHFHLLLGAVFAFLIVDGVAVLMGSWFINIVPTIFVRILSGIVFLIFGMLLLREKEVKKENKSYFKSSFLSGFILIFLTEWGDKTQITSGLLATKYRPIMVLIGTMIAVTFLSIIEIYLGKLMGNRFNRKIVTRVAGIVFILMGLSFFIF